MALVLVAVASVLLTFSFCAHVYDWAADREYKKTHDCCQPWVFVEKTLRSTSTGGVAVSYDDYDLTYDLQRVQNHCRGAYGRDR